MSKQSTGWRFKNLSNYVLYIGTNELFGRLHYYLKDNVMINDLEKKRYDGIVKEIENLLTSEQLETFRNEERKDHKG